MRCAPWRNSWLSLDRISRRSSGPATQRGGFLLQNSPKLVKTYYNYGWKIIYAFTWGSTEGPRGLRALLGPLKFKAVLALLGPLRLKAVLALLGPLKFKAVSAFERSGVSHPIMQQHTIDNTAMSTSSLAQHAPICAKTSYIRAGLIPQSLQLQATRLTSQVGRVRKSCARNSLCFCSHMTE